VGPFELKKFAALAGIFKVWGLSIRRG